MEELFLISRKFLHEVPFAEERKISLAQCIFHGGFRGDSEFPSSPVKRLRHSPGTGRKSAILAPLVALCAPSSLKSLQTSHNPPKRPLWGLAAPGVEPPPISPPENANMICSDWAYRSGFYQTRLFGGIFSLSIRPAYSPGKGSLVLFRPGLRCACPGFWDAKFILSPETPARRSRGWGEKYKGALGKNRWGRGGWGKFE